MIIIALYFTAPILQIIASTLRIKGIINIPIGGIMFLTCFLGIVLSFAAMNTIILPASPNGLRCGMPLMATLFCGLFFQAITSPIIAIVSYIVFIVYKRRMKNRSISN